MFNSREGRLIGAPANPLPTETPAKSLGSHAAAMAARPGPDSPEPMAQLRLKRDDRVSWRILIVWPHLRFASQAQQPRPGGPRATRPQPLARPERSARGRHHPGHPEAHSHRRAGVLRRGPAIRLEVSDVVAADLERSGLFRAARPGLLHRPPARLNAAAALPGLAGDQCPGGGGGGGPGARMAVVGEFRLWDVFSGRQLPRSDCVGQTEWRRLGAPHRRPGLSAPHRREGLLRHPDRLHRRDRPQGQAQQAARHDGPGRRQRAAAEPGARAGATPRFSPTSQEIAFMQYTGDQPRVFLMNLETGQRELLGNFPA